MKKQDNEKEQAANVYTLLPAVLDEMIEYIEGMEEVVDGEWGMCRPVKQLITDNCMPELYGKLLAIKNSR